MAIFLFPNNQDLNAKEILPLCRHDYRRPAGPAEQDDLFFGDVRAAFM